MLPVDAAADVITMRNITSIIMIVVVVITMSMQNTQGGR